MSQEETSIIIQCTYYRFYFDAQINKSAIGWEGLAYLYQYHASDLNQLDGKLILIIEVSEGVSKAYCDKDGVYWVKSGSDKRKASPQELVRLFQQSAQITLDETTTSAGIGQIDKAKFFTFFEKIY